MYLFQSRAPLQEHFFDNCELGRHGDVKLHMCLQIPKLWADVPQLFRQPSPKLSPAHRPDETHTHTQTHRLGDTMKDGTSESSILLMVIVESEVETLENLGAGWWSPLHVGV